MPEFTSHAPGTPSWVDLMSPDVDASKAFYSQVFDWDAEDQLDDDGNHVYVMFLQDGKNVAGLGGQPPGMPPEMPAVWNTYIATDDCAATMAKVTEAGGSVMMPPMQVMTSGEMAVFADSTGAAFSVWKAGDHHGAEICNEPNTWSWNEMLSRDLESAKDFYGKVFGWTFQSMDMGEGSMYHLVEGGTNDEGMGGFMEMPADVPPQAPNHWMTYFSVADCAASCDLVRAAGGQVLNGPFPIPGVGTVAVIHDPSNAVFSLMQPES